VIEEGETVKEATLITGINIRTAQYYIKKYNEDDERRLPDGYRRPRVRHPRKLTDAYSQFLMKYIDMHPTAVLDIRDKLCQISRFVYISAGVT
jgi:transposase